MPTRRRLEHQELTKKQVVDMLENATIEQLQELRESINEKIRIMTSKY